jgi:hypothetical protein
MGRGEPRWDSRPNLPRAGRPCRGKPASAGVGSWSSMVPLGDDPPYLRVGCDAPATVLLSGSTSFRSGGLALIHQIGAPQMASLVTRTRRLALTVGPLVAIALTLAAGHRW